MLPVILSIGIIVDTGAVECPDHTGADGETDEEPGAHAQPYLLTEFAVDEGVFVWAGESLGRNAKRPEMTTTTSRDSRKTTKMTS
jgi:hypothetical protein